MEVIVYRDLNYGTLNPRRCNLNVGLKRPWCTTSKTSLDLFIPSKYVRNQRSVSTLFDDGKSPILANTQQIEGQQLSVQGTVNSPTSGLVVFIHGGGWRRGHTRNWQHFLSRFDSNLLVSLYAKYCNHYQNIGESFARMGYACAVLTYPFVAPPTKVVIVETITSLLMSWSLFLVPSSLSYMLFSFASYFTGTKSVLLANDSCDWLFAIVTSLLASQLLTKMLVSLNSPNYAVPTDTGDEERSTPTGRCSVTSWVVALYTSFILYLSVFVCARPQLIILVLIDAVFTQIVITSLQIWNWRKQGNRDAVDNVREQLGCIASAIRWLQTLSLVNPGHYDHKCIVLCGHSAGGSMASLLGLDSSYLKSVGVDCTHIKGIISVSGIYDISSMNLSPTIRFFYLIPVFGENSQNWKKVSPVEKINRHSAWKAKFLLISSSWEPINKSDADDFERSLTSSNYDCQTVRLSSRTHYTILNSFKTSKTPSLIEKVCEKFINELS